MEVVINNQYTDNNLLHIDATIDNINYSDITPKFIRNKQIFGETTDLSQKQIPNINQGINAIDIDWNGVKLSNGTEIFSTSDLIKLVNKLLEANPNIELEEELNINKTYCYYANGTFDVYDFEDGVIPPFFNCVLDEYNYLEIHPYTSVIIGNNVKIISEYAFCHNTTLQQIDFGPNVETISMSAFENCENISLLNLVDSIKTVEFNAFNGCVSLNTVIINHNDIDINDNAFNFCPNISEFIGDSNMIQDNGVLLVKDGTIIAVAGLNLNIYAIPEGITGVNDFVFSSLPLLTSLTFPDTLETLGIGAVSFCNNLKHVKFGNNLTKLPMQCFMLCEKLSQITLNNSITEIEDYAFMECNNLATIAFNGTLSEWKNITKSEYWNLGMNPNVKIYCTNGII